MGDKTAIAWTESTWNPVTGCTEVSPGCDHCYARTVAHRFDGTKAYPNGFNVTLRPERLEQPLRWTRRRMIFVNSMSDLFHAEISDDYIAQVFAVMALADRHTFQILTKRHGRMRALLSSPDFHEQVRRHRQVLSHQYPAMATTGRDSEGVWPRPNVWLGVSVEDQKRAELRIPALLKTPAKVRFLSCEPLLGRVTLKSLRISGEHSVDWVIVGGESGSGARRMDPAWATDLAAECADLKVAFFMKQTGSFLAREWGLRGKGEKPADWPTPFPREMPGEQA